MLSNHTHLVGACASSNHPFLLPDAPCCLDQAFQLVSQLEGIIPALETSHALAYLKKLCPTLKVG
jgi:hypothetical protein